MKKFYLPLSLLSVFLLVSCSPHLVTQGITDKTSNYIVTADGKQINASAVTFNNTTVSADTKTYPVESLSALKVGTAYYGIQDGVFYDGVYYGKLMLLRRNTGIAYDMSTHTSHPTYSYFLQKQGQADILRLTNRNLIESVDDDPLALKKARAARVYSTVNTVSLFTALAAVSCVFLPYNNKIRKPGVTIGLISMPTFLITLPIAGHKRYKTIIVYNTDI